MAGTPEPAAYEQGAQLNPSIRAVGNTAGRDFSIVQQNIYPQAFLPRPPEERERQPVLGRKIRLIGAAALGNLLGVAASGLIAVVSGQVFAPGSHWLAALPGLIVLGALSGPIIAWFTRRWFFPGAFTRRTGARRRTLLFTAAASVVVPLAVAVGELPDDAVTTMVPLWFLGSAVTAMLWMSAFPRTGTG